MIECFSNNLSVNTGESVSFSNKILKKGNTVDGSGASLQFNKCGIYELSLHATAVAPSATDSVPADVTLQLKKDGADQPQATASSTVASATAKTNLAFTTLIQVSKNNSSCPCASPTVCSVVNSGAPAVFDVIDVTVTKIV